MHKSEGERVKMIRKAGDYVRKCVGVREDENQLMYVGRPYNLCELEGGPFYMGEVVADSRFKKMTMI